MYNQLTQKDLNSIKANVQKLLGDRGYSSIFYFDASQKPKIPDLNIILQPEVWDCNNWVWFFDVYPELNPNKSESILNKTKSFFSNFFS